MKKVIVYVISLMVSTSLFASSAELITAAQNCRIWAAKASIEDSSTDINIRDEDGRTPLILASIDDCFEIVKRLTEKADLEAKDKISGWAALTYAAAYNHSKIVRFLIEKGAEVNTKDNEEKTPLMVAAHNGHKRIVKILVEEGRADIDLLDKHDWPALGFAAEKDRLGIVKYLVEKGAHINVVVWAFPQEGKKQQTILDSATGRSYKYLRKIGAKSYSELIIKK